MVSFFGRSGIKYRLHRSAEVATLGPAPDPVSKTLLALTGYGTDGLIERLEAGADPLLYYSGLFSMRPRSAERLSALLSDWLGRPVEVRQFAGTWLGLPPEQRTPLPGPRSAGAWNALGGGAAIGVRSWNLHARIVLCIGPLDRAAFEALLPDQPGYRRLAGLVQRFSAPRQASRLTRCWRARRAFRSAWAAWGTISAGLEHLDFPRLRNPPVRRIRGAV